VVQIFPSILLIFCLVILSFPKGRMLKYTRMIVNYLFLLLLFSVSASCILKLVELVLIYDYHCQKKEDPSLPLVIHFVLRYILSNTNIATLVFLFLLLL
jgi:hypothetical protein